MVLVTSFSVARISNGVLLLYSSVYFVIYWIISEMWIKLYRVLKILCVKREFYCIVEICWEFNESFDDLMIKVDIVKVSED